MILMVAHCPLVPNRLQKHDLMKIGLPSTAESSSNWGISFTVKYRCPRAILIRFSGYGPSHIRIVDAPLLSRTIEIPITRLTR